MLDDQAELRLHTDSCAAAPCGQIASVRLGTLEVGNQGGHDADGQPAHEGIGNEGDDRNPAVDESSDQIVHNAEFRSGRPPTYRL